MFSTHQTCDSCCLARCTRISGLHEGSRSLRNCKSSGWFLVAYVRTCRQDQGRSRSACPVYEGRIWQSQTGQVPMPWSGDGAQPTACWRRSQWMSPRVEDGVCHSAGEPDTCAAPRPHSSASCSVKVSHATVAAAAVEKEAIGYRSSKSRRSADSTCWRMDRASNVDLEACSEKLAAELPRVLRPKARLQ